MQKHVITLKTKAHEEVLVKYKALPRKEYTLEVGIKYLFYNGIKLMGIYSLKGIHEAEYQLFYHKKKDVYYYQTIK